jgi:hypothetical protein
MLKVPVEVEVTLRPTVSRPVSLGVRRPSGTRDQFYFRLEIFFRQLQVCNLLYNCFWALPELSLLGRRPAELTAIFYCLIWDSPNLESQVLVFRCHVRAERNFQCYHWEGCMGSMQCNVEFGYQLSICSGTKETTENLDRVGRSQDLQNANWLLASSPALNPWTLTSVPTLCCCVFL